MCLVPSWPVAAARAGGTLLSPGLAAGGILPAGFLDGCQCQCTSALAEGLLLARSSGGGGGASMRLRSALFVAACLGELVTANMSFALISPFFPIYAPTVGLQLADVTLIFGAMSFAQLVASPLAGPAITAAGRRTTLCVGTTLLSVSGTAFGVVPPLLDQGSAALSGVAAPWLRETLVGLRFVQGVGAALTTTCIFAVLADAFPASVGKVMGAAELAAGLGWTLAPPLGGLLYNAGGYSFPFTVFGPMPLCFVVCAPHTTPLSWLPSARSDSVCHGSS